MTRVVLGSASAGRLSVLRKAGIEPVVRVSGVDEDAILAALGSRPSAGAAVCALAGAKADHVADDLDAGLRADCVILGCDSMLLLDDTLRGKPADAVAARAQWETMAGRPGEFYTGHCALRLRDGRVHRRETEFAVTTVHFGTPSAEDLDAYVASGEPLHVAGSFTLDGLGGWFIEGISGDPSNVIGISLPLTRRLLTRVGLSTSTLWQANPAN